MVARLVLCLAALGLVAGQAEQSIFAQFIYPPAAAATEKPVTKPTAAPHEETTRYLEVLPLLARARRSGFSREGDKGGNDVIVNRFRTKMSDPGWVPQIFPRFGGEKSDYDYK